MGKPPKETSTDWQRQREQAYRDYYKGIVCTGSEVQTAVSVEIRAARRRSHIYTPYNLQSYMKRKFTGVSESMSEHCWQRRIINSSSIRNRQQFLLHPQQQLPRNDHRWNAVSTAINIYGIFTCINTQKTWVCCGHHTFCTPAGVLSISVHCTVVRSELHTSPWCVNSCV